MAGHPPVGGAAHLEQPEQHLGHLQVRLPQHEAPTDLRTPIVIYSVVSLDDIAD